MKVYCLLYSLFFTLAAFAQKPLVFVHLTDTHIGSETGADDLRRTVKDINNNSALQFVVISGDITEFGADQEIGLAKQILDSLNKPWYIVPGNHDGNWSESGANTFKTVFGNETFSFKAGRYQFLGTHCGPNMRMGPGQIPRENIVWLDSILKTIPDTVPVIFVNHYPIDSSLNNWYDAIDLLKKKNVQLILCGHGHANHVLDFEGIPGIMGRSNLRARDSVGGYNIVTINDSLVTYETRLPGIMTQPVWARVILKDHHFSKELTSYPRPSYQVQRDFPQVKEKWIYQDKSDIGSGTAAAKGKLVTTNTNGEVVAINIADGKPLWRYRTSGKIYAIPAIAGNIVIAPSSDHYVYALSLQTGRLLWKFKAEKSVLANPVIHNNTVYIGSSDGHFRALVLETGALRWDFPQVKGFVVTKPLVYGAYIYFGCWNNDFYCLELATGKMVWKWNNGASNRMFSPAACFPVAAHNRVFLVAPDRYMTALDAGTGSLIWRKQLPDLKVRESMGLSADSSRVFVKTMQGEVHGISTTADDMTSVWKSEVSLGYEICPTAITEYQGIVFVPTQSGTAVALDEKTGRLLWKHKVSNGLITHLLPLPERRLAVTTMDGKIAMLTF